MRDRQGGRSRASTGSEPEYTGTPGASRGSGLLSALLVCFGAGCLSISIAIAVVVLPDSSLPTGPVFGDLPEDLPPPNEGAFEGGATGTSEDGGIGNSASEDETDDGGGFNVPTGGPPSPLFGTRSFTQPMLRFEEFGTEPFPERPTPGRPFPAPTAGPAPEQTLTGVAQSAPAGADLDAFLAQPGIDPLPTRLSNCIDENPWKLQIEAFLGRALDSPPAEGRPPGEGWAHQRWDEFPPEVFFKTAQTGSRENLGLRDTRQLHQYLAGEWGPAGLYHNTAGLPSTAGTTRGITIRFHPNMPIQDHKAMWTFDGTLPPKLLMVRLGEPILMRHYNALPIDPAANFGFGLHTLTTHAHNGHQPGESDGYTQAFFFPGQFYDYRWPLQLAGRDTINSDASDPRAGMPDGEGGIAQIAGDWRETMSTHWFHDHMLDFTAQNVYKGNVAMMNYYSALDRGNEGLDDGVNLRFPSGTALDWGNRDYDVNLLIAEKAWDSEGQLWFNIFNLNGFVGDHILTNWLYHPFLEVRARRYRFRFLNAAVSRYFKFALVRQVDGDDGEMAGPPGSGVSYDRVPFHMIANDGNIMEHAVAFDGTLGTQKGVLPTQGIAERYDIVVDFASFEVGDKLYFVNVLEHTDGRRPKRAIPLEDILSEAYLAVAMDDDGDGAFDRWRNGDPCVGRFMELRVREFTDADLSMEPADFVAGKKKMIPLPGFTKDELANALHRTFLFGRSNSTDRAPWTIKTDGGRGFGMDPRRVSAAPNLGDLTEEGLGHVEIWHLINGGGGWSHPIHIHFEEGTILKRDGKDPPEWEKWTRKDMYRIGTQPDSGRTVEVALRFREFAGTFMEHCHNTQHEDHAMLLRYDIERPGQFKIMVTPMPTWDGVGFVDTVALPTARTGDGVGPSFQDDD